MTHTRVSAEHFEGAMSSATLRTSSGVTARICSAVVEMSWIVSKYNRLLASDIARFSTWSELTRSCPQYCLLIFSKAVSESLDCARRSSSLEMMRRHFPTVAGSDRNI